MTTAMSYNFNEEYRLKNHCCRMYVKPCTEEAVRDLEYLMNNEGASSKLKIEMKRGWYEITSLQQIGDTFDYIYSLWGITHRKFISQSKGDYPQVKIISNKAYLKSRKWYQKIFDFFFSREPEVAVVAV
ncbi:MAG: hypothetical protein IJW20_03175 [Clostridia bacterium]|nr:hypothetical protein [Clostridia bacterium]